MTESPGNPNPPGESNTSRWILFGGIGIIVVSLILLIAGVIYSGRDRVYENPPSDRPTDSEPSETQISSLADPEIGSQGEDPVEPVSSESTSELSQPAEPEAESAEIPPAEAPKVAQGTNFPWQGVDEDSVSSTSLPQYPRVVEDRALVQVTSILWNADVGQTIQIPIPQRGVVLEGEVLEVTGGSRARSLIGELQDGEMRYPFVLTSGDKSAFANVTTATGVYELFANREYGWLMPMGNMDDHVDFSLPDHFIENPDPYSEDAHPPHSHDH